MIFHAVKDAIGALKRCEKEEENKNEDKEELEKLKENQEQSRSNDERRDVEWWSYLDVEDTCHETVLNFVMRHAHRSLKFVMFQLRINFLK